MKPARHPAPGEVLGPNGRWITLADLPPSDTTRWVARRKAEVVAAVRGGLLSLNEACVRYGLSIEEFVSWQRNVERYGLEGLRAGHQERHTDRRRPAHNGHEQHAYPS